MRRQALDQELQGLQARLLALGDMVETALVQSVESLERPDFESVERLTTQIRMINKERFSIETEAFVLVARRPAQVDLGSVTATLEIAAELERMGDYANSIARISLMMDMQPHSSALEDVHRLAEKVRSMLRQALKAVVEQDVAVAQAIAHERSQVDALYNEACQKLLAGEPLHSHPSDQASSLRWVAYKLERTAKRVNNICGWVVFMITGEMDADDAGYHAA